MAEVFKVQAAYCLGRALQVLDECPPRQIGAIKLDILAVQLKRVTRRDILPVLLRSKTPDSLVYEHLALRVDATAHLCPGNPPQALLDGFTLQHSQTWQSPHTSIRFDTPTHEQDAF